MLGRAACAACAAPARASGRRRVVPLVGQHDARGSRASARPATCSGPKAFCPLASACSSSCCALSIRAEPAIGPAHRRQHLRLQLRAPRPAPSAPAPRRRRAARARSARRTWCGSHTDPRCVSSPISSSLTLTALAASRCARSRSADSRARVDTRSGRRPAARPRRDVATPAACRRTNLRDAIAGRVRPRADRLVTQEAAEVVRERVDRGVALRGVLLQRLARRWCRDRRAAAGAAWPASCRSGPRGGRRASSGSAGAPRHRRRAAARSRRSRGAASPGTRAPRPAGC